MRRLGTWMCVCMWLLAAAHAEAQVTVRKTAGGKSPIDFTGFSAARQGAADLFLRTLQNDLIRSGWFSTARRGEGEFRLLGSAEESRGNVRVACEVYSTGDGKRRFGQSYKDDSRNVHKLAHAVADDIVEKVLGRKGIASTRIVMIGTRTNSKELYLCDADGGGLIPLTRDRNVSVAPEWGPRADRVVYTSYLKGYPDVYLIHLASGNRDRVSQYPGLNTGADISPDGRDLALVLSKDGNPELYIKNLGSGRLTRVTNTPRAAEASPSWSPDGRQIVYVSDSSGKPQLYTISRSGGRPRRLRVGGWENVSPDWGPHGLIAYTTRRGGRYEICVVDPRTSAVTNIPQDGGDYEDPSWAPDGRHIVCSRTQRYRSKVYILDTMGDRPVALTDYEGDWYSPAWSPK